MTFLSYRGIGIHIIGGVGTFHADLPGVPVSESIAAQYDTDDMRAQGWIVTREQADTPESLTRGTARRAPTTRRNTVPDATDLPAQAGATDVPERSED